MKYFVRLSQLICPSRGHLQFCCEPPSTKNKRNTTQKRSLEFSSSLVSPSACMTGQVEEERR